MDEVNEVVSVINCSFKGMEVAGHFGKDSIKAFLKMMLFLWNSGKSLAKIGWDAKERHRLTTSGKLNRKTMRERFGDAIIYKEMKIVAKEVYDNEIRNADSKLSREELKKFRPTEKEQMAHWEKMAKKHGLNYIKFPKPDGGYILQVPKEQEAIYEEVYKQHCEWIKKEAKAYYKEVAKERKAESAKVTGEDIYESMTDKSKAVLANPYPMLSKDEVLSVIANLSGEEFTAGMKEAFPGYNADAPFDGKTVDEIIHEVKLSNMPESKKKEIFDALEGIEHKYEREKGLLQDFTINKKKMKIQEVDGKTTITFQHPKHPNVKVTVDAKDLRGKMKWSGSTASFSLKKDCDVQITMYKMTVRKNVKTIKTEEHKMRLSGLDDKIRNDAAKAQKKASRKKVSKAKGLKTKIK